MQSSGKRRWDHLKATLDHIAPERQLVSLTIGNYSGLIGVGELFSEGLRRLDQAGERSDDFARLFTGDSTPEPPNNKAKRWDPVFTASAQLHKVSEPTQQNPWGTITDTLGPLPVLANGAWIEIDDQGTVTGSKDEEDFDGEKSNGFGFIYMEISFINTGNNPVIRAEASAKSSPHGINNQDWAVLVAEYVPVEPGE